MDHLSRMTAGVVVLYILEIVMVRYFADLEEMAVEWTLTVPKGFTISETKNLLIDRCASKVQSSSRLAMMN